MKAMTRMARAPEPWGPAGAREHLEVHQVAPHEGQEGTAYQDDQAQHHAGGGREGGGHLGLGVGGKRAARRPQASPQTTPTTASRGPCRI